jgi:hypothetical protein
MRQRARHLLVCPQNGVQIKIGLGLAMVKALRRWLEAHELLAIVTAVAGALALLSMLLVFGGYLLVTR